MTKWTPGPWLHKDVPGAGLEIFGPVHLVEAVVLPKGIPEEPINIFGLAQPQTVLIAYERWVQFAPKGWKEMQEANAMLIAQAPAMYEALEDFTIRGHHDTCDAVKFDQIDSKYPCNCGHDNAQKVMAKARGE